ncbi:MAG: phosphoglycerate kinase [Candidatus Nealsonbacteria bacterium]
MIMKTLKDFDVRGKRVLVRVDFNVPLSERGEILDDFRIRETLPTIRYLIKKGAKLLLMSHLGNPGGKFVKELQLTPVSERLAELLGEKVELLENLRFNSGEEQNDENFAKELAQKGDIYINDAFGACHRAHASIVGISKFLPSGAGFLLEKEVESLTKLSINPEKPLVAIIGGAKVETKVVMIDKISEKADFVLISGLIGKGVVGQKIALKYPEKIVFPVDETGGGKDIGQETVKLFKAKIAEAKTIFWNGPLGKIEDEEFASGTEELAKAIAESCAFTVVGGGETVEFITELGLIKKFSHVSSGGGAMLAFLSGEKLPGLEALG